MWSCERRAALRQIGRMAVTLAAAGLTAGCFQPLYASRPTAGVEGIRDKFSAVEILRIPAGEGTPTARLAVALRNALQFDFNGGAGANAPTHQLKIALGTSQLYVIVDVTSGRANAQVDSVTATYSLIEIATNKIVFTDNTFSRVSYDIPGSAQRFAKQRAQRDAEDRAIEIVAENIRNRLASYFVAGT
jgi:LPS-assembly lipoprotein